MPDDLTGAPARHAASLRFLQADFVRDLDWNKIGGCVSNELPLSRSSLYQLFDICIATHISTFVPTHSSTQLRIMPGSY